MRSSPSHTCTIQKLSSDHLYCPRTSLQPAWSASPEHNSHAMRCELLFEIIAVEILSIARDMAFGWRRACPERSRMGLQACIVGCKNSALAAEVRSRSATDQLV